MHFVAGNAGEFASAKTRRPLPPVKFAPGHANNPIAPESIVKKIRLGAVNEIFLFTMIRRVWLNHKTLGKVASARTESGAMAIEIDLVRHVVKSPHAVTLTAGEPGFRTFQTCRIGHGRIRLCCEMNFETANRITIALNVFAPFTVAGFARDPELGHLRIPLVVGDKPCLPLRDMAIHARAIPRSHIIIFLHGWRKQEVLAHWRPHFLSDDVTEWKLLQSAALACLQPWDL